MTKEEFYKSKEKEYSDIDQEAHLRYNRAIKLADIRSNSIILDIGCKYALLKYMLKDKNINVDYFGIDITDKVFSRIENFDSTRFKIADASKGIPFEDEKFDYVFALEILEHVESPTKMLQEIHRVLKPNGVLILSVPNPYAWNEIISNIKNLPDTEGHISAFTKQIMDRLLKFTDFKIHEHCGTFARLPLSKKILKKRYYIFSTNNIFLSRSYIYKIIKNI